jgi:hypothetical protein
LQILLWICQSRQAGKKEKDDMTRQVEKIVYNIRVGKPEVKPDAPSHVKGVRMGNQPGNTEKEPGINHKDPLKTVADSRRSTGISPDMHNPIDPDMPNLTPA